MTVKPGRCPRCRAPVLSGLSGGRLLSMDATVDPGPLTPAGELAALVAGCRTWTLHTVAAELHHRDARTIAARPAGTIARQTVHADHRCTRTPGGPST